MFFDERETNKIEYNFAHITFTFIQIVCFRIYIVDEILVYLHTIFRSAQPVVVAVSVLLALVVSVVWLCHPTNTTANIINKHINSFSIVDLESNFIYYNILQCISYGKGAHIVYLVTLNCFRRHSFELQQGTARERERIKNEF